MKASTSSAALRLTALDGSMFPFDFGTGVFGEGLDLPTIKTCSGLDAA